jgi:DNA adenine methylase
MKKLIPPWKLAGHAAPALTSHFTPLRYPGGKAKLAPFIKSVLRANDLIGGEYAEPFAGGAGIALELLFEEYVKKIHINDVSRPIYSFWKSILDDTEKFVRLVHDTPLNLKAWDRQKEIFQSEPRDRLALGFAAFYLNRTNRSGILNGGVIGGRDQSGEWGIGARFNRKKLIKRIEAIANKKTKINLSKKDALDFLKKKSKTWPTKTLIYLDPPYFLKGRDLYYDYYNEQDHLDLRNFVTKNFLNKNWIVSYDNEAPVRNLYRGFQQTVYGLDYTAREFRGGSEIMFFSDSLEVPSLVGPFTLFRHTTADKRLRPHKRIILENWNIAKKQRVAAA